MAQVVGRDDAIARLREVAALASEAEACGEDVGDFVYGPAGARVDPESIPAALLEFCNVTNGMRCDGIVLYGGSGFLGIGAALAERLPDGNERWCGIGEIADVPVFMDRSDGTIWHALDATSEDFQRAEMTQIATDIWSFVTWYVIGPGYVEIFTEEEYEDDDEEFEWAVFLRRNGFLEPRQDKFQV